MSGLHLALVAATVMGAAACSCPPNPEYRELASGDYRAEDDPTHRLTVDASGTILEVFTRDGKQVAISYRVTAVTRHEH